jgi:hypothetical protein
MLALLMLNLVATLTLHTGASAMQPVGYAKVSSPPSDNGSLRIDPRMPRYKNPRPEAPRSRIYGHARTPSKEPALLALVPDHIGYTLNNQPTLCWYVSEKSPFPLMLTLIDTRSIQPLLHVMLPSAAEPGIHAIRLADYQASLEPSVPYRWFLSLVVDPENPSKDIVTGGVVEYVSAGDMAASTQDCKADDKVCRYAGAGLWYDALAAVSDLITSAPQDRLLRMQRASLLQQVDLNEVAEWDLEQIARH